MNLKITSLAIVALGLGLTTGISLTNVTRGQIQMQGLATGTHQHFNEIDRGDDKFEFQGSTKGATDRYYNLTLSVESQKVMLDKFDDFAWWIWLTAEYADEHWILATFFHIHMHGGGYYNDQESLELLIADENPYVYHGGGWGEFDLADFKSTMEEGIATNTRIKLRFYCEYAFLAHNHYAAMWYVD